MAASTIAKAPPFFLPRCLTSTPRILNHFQADAAAAGTAGVCEVGTLELPAAVLLDRIDDLLKLFDQIHAQLLLAGAFHHLLAVRRSLKCLARLPSPSPAWVARFLAGLKAPTPRRLCRQHCPPRPPRLRRPTHCPPILRCLVVPKGIVPNHYTVLLLAKACAEVADRQEGEKVSDHQ